MQNRWQRKGMNVSDPQVKGYQRKATLPSNTEVYQTPFKIVSRQFVSRNGEKGLKGESRVEGAKVEGVKTPLCFLHPRAISSAIAINFEGRGMVRSYPQRG
ncbi:hypothetical protein POVCU2_0020320 [Plasmodium ovale curtisi]|uniref:Uncharacterized protein n=1 Tax=Plasmodium ovale curtisi TaxID=864141 RepID=A0A1A8VVH0_PLAOA|nr:hypothetical protein POVCU2_0020320 [Plasmodium ovale curtisi]